MMSSGKATSSALQLRLLRGRRLELWSWYFFRWSGLLLVFLALGHVLIMHIVNNVDVINYAFVADRWQAIGWRIYDWLLLALALTHGMNGLRVVLDDYVHVQRWRVVCLSLGWGLYVVLIVIGTLTIATFPHLSGRRT
jgi:succinate dehydrogenase / fumarate reductase membrane anchor subunit